MKRWIAQVQLEVDGLTQELWVTVRADGRDEASDRVRFLGMVIAIKRGARRVALLDVPFLREADASR